MMRAYEFVVETQNFAVQPDIVKRTARVGKLVKKMADSEKQQPATELDKVQAVMNYSKLKKQANKNYVQRLKQELVNATAGTK